MTAAGFRFIDLFAGIGGFHHALTAPGFGGECVMACEIDDECQRVYKASFPETPLIGNIRDVTRNGEGADATLESISHAVPDHDVLCAGFPCQPFSKSGFQHGTLDRTRGTLFFDIMRIIGAKRPRFAILENVRNLAGPRHRDTWATIVAALRAEGYRVADKPLVFTPHLLPPELGGRPQVRDRVFILAERVSDGPTAETYLREPLVERKPYPGWDPLRWRILDWLDPEEAVVNRHVYELKTRERVWIEAWNEFVQQIPAETLPGFPIWVDAFVPEPELSVDLPKWKRDFLIKNSAFYVQHRRVIDRWLQKRWSDGSRVEDFPPSRRKFEWQARVAQPRREDRDLWGLVMHLRPSGIRVKAPNYLPALVAITQTSVIGPRHRRITPGESARLQGLPHDVFERAGVDDKVAYKQLGNAVNAGAVQHVARALFASANEAWGAVPHLQEPATLGLSAKLTWGASSPERVEARAGRQLNLLVHDYAD